VTVVDWLLDPASTEAWRALGLVRWNTLRALRVLRWHEQAGS
jgi:hypothetical protein